MTYALTMTIQTCKQTVGNSDYSISTSEVNMLYNKPDPPDNVMLTFHTDNIAQEPNETLTLVLLAALETTDLPTGDGVFFRNITNVTIADSDSKRSSP